MGFILCIIYISYIWKKNFGDELFGDTLLYATNGLTGVLPTDGKFLSLKFSAFRHAFVFIVFALLIYFVNIKWLNSVLLWLNLCYAITAVLRQRTRKKMMKEMWTEVENDPDDEIVCLQKQTLKATGSVSVYSVYLALLLYVVYAIRP